MMPEISITATDPVSGKEDTVAIDPADLVSVILPFQPATINPEVFKSLAAKKWRHQETDWYEKEHKFLTRILRQYPSMAPFIAEMRLLLSAVFVKHAEEWRRVRLHQQSRKAFDRKYADFVKKWKGQPRLTMYIGGSLPEGPEQYLQSVHSWSYFHLRNVTLPRLVEGTRES